MKPFRILFLVAGAGLLYLYYRFDPAQGGLFPPCPFRWLTGLPCPGCGSQRCVHHLLHGRLHTAFLHNPLLVLSLPYVLLGIVVEYSPLRSTYPVFRQRWFGLKAARLGLLVVLLWWGWRIGQALL
ncbi:DUF2752 domain-containing protein [Tellurirhabdus rosea]|uniref:DUF2752 domain-containing protein n=1 Tax=Tellurirhabdus rosea TaxID=2674997 RepID=UPI002258309B|nr:DUF2752 domain-containing protein [Tellurirhabdus rosea]